MGLRPTRRNESHHVTPAKAGVHVWQELDSRSPAFAEDKLRGNDDIQGSHPRHSHSRVSGNPLRSKARAERVAVIPAKLVLREGGGAGIHCVCLNRIRSEFN